MKESKLNIKINQYIDHMYPVMLLLILRCTTVAVSADNRNGSMMIVYKKNGTKD